MAVAAGGTIAGRPALAVLAAALLLGLPAPAIAQPAPPRLAAVAVGPGHREAVFAAPDGSWTPAGEGDSVGGFRVLRIAPGEAEIAGPDGQRRLVPVPGAAAAPAAPPAPPPFPPSPAEPSGLTLARAALRHDECVRRGLLPAGEADANDRLTGLIEKIAKAPPVRGAPAGMAARWMEDGRTAAQRDARYQPMDPQSCRQAAADWAAEAQRYGLK